MGIIFQLVNNIFQQNRLDIRSSIYKTELKDLATSINQYLNLTGDGCPVLTQCPKLNKTVTRTVTKRFKQLLQAYDYIINENKLLAEKIQSKWAKYFSNYSLKEQQKLSVYNTLCSKLYLSVPLQKLNTLNNLMRFMNVNPIFASNNKVTALSNSFLPTIDFWTLFSVKRTHRNVGNKKVDKMRMYNIDITESIARNVDGWINTNKVSDFNGLFGENVLIGMFSSDKCTSDGMQSLGLMCESVCVVMGPKASSSFTSTVVSCCFGNIKDSTETFNELYKQNNLRNRVNSIFRRPVVVTVCIYDDQSRSVSSCVISFDTQIHQNLNQKRKENMQHYENKWNELNQKETNQLIDNVNNEIETDYELIQSRTRDSFGFSALRQKRKTNKANCLQFQWYNNFKDLKQWFNTTTMQEIYFPIKGASSNATSEIDRVINQFCHKFVSADCDLPYLDEFKLNVCLFVWNVLRISWNIWFICLECIAYFLEYIVLFVWNIFGLFVWNIQFISWNVLRISWNILFLYWNRLQEEICVHNRCKNGKVVMNPYFLMLMTPSI